MRGGLSLFLFSLFFSPPLVLLFRLRPPPEKKTKTHQAWDTGGLTEDDWLTPRWDKIGNLTTAAQTLEETGGGWGLRPWYLGVSTSASPAPSPSPSAAPQPA